MKILYVYGSMASFTRADLETLRSAHLVRELHFRRDPMHVLGSIAAAIRGAMWADAIVAWFGSIHALVPFAAGRLLGRPCLVIAGGYDVAIEPAIDYGNMRGGIRKAIGMAVFRLADRVLTFSQCAARDAIVNAKVPPAELEVILLGVPDAQPSVPAAAGGERRSVITVSIVNESNLSRKGLTTFVRAAALLPEVPFVLVGEWDGGAIEQLRAMASPNVEFTGWISDGELRARMHGAGAYVQVSFHEAFGVALAEAMLCGCVPVATERGSLPEVVGDTGYCVPYGDPKATADAIRSALDSPELGAAARTRILTCFPPSLRRGKLLDVLKRLDKRSHGDHATP